MTEQGFVVQPLSARQRSVLLFVQRFYAATGEHCSVYYLARRLGLSRASVRVHLHDLWRKGWLLSPTPDGLRCAHEPSSETSRPK